MNQRSSTPKTVELWIQSFAPAAVGPAHERALEYLEALESRPEIAEINVGVWGKEIERTGRTQRVPQIRTIEARLAAFDEWASRTGRSLEPFFRTRHVDSAITGAAYEVRRLPTVAVAEYRGDELVHVAPSCDGDRIVDALERLAALARGEGDAPTLALNDETADRRASNVEGDTHTRARDGRNGGDERDGRPPEESRRLEPSPGSS